MPDPLKYLGLLEKLLLHKCVCLRDYGVSVAELHWILPASQKQDSTVIFVTAVGILVIAIVVILVTTSTAVTVL